MNLVTELRKTAQRNYQNQLDEAEQTLESVKANLQLQDSEDMEMLKFFGTKEVVKEQTAKITEVKKFINSEYLTREDIKSVCIRYMLRFLSASLYKKEIPLSALNDLKRFQEDNNISDAALSRNLYVIAPQNHFKLGPRPSKDPALVYANPDNTFTVISKWGSDFSFFRRIKGILAWHPAVTGMVLSAVLLNLICALIYICKKTDGEEFFVNILLMFWIFAALEIDPWSSKWDQPFR